MAIYAIGDIQGCLDELLELLNKLQFEPQHDQLWLVGDLVNRGPQSLETLRFVRSLGHAATTVLGNHDLHLLALALSPQHDSVPAELQPVLQAADRDELITWLRHRPLLHFDAGLNTMMVHAGIVPQWDLATAEQCAAEVEAVLRGPQPEHLLAGMYGGKPNRWSPELCGIERLRFIVNSLTRIRYCRTDGSLDFKAKLAPDHYQDNSGGKYKEGKSLQPWFRGEHRRMADSRIVFGHWSTLGLIVDTNILALDTGCVWGGKLTAIRLDETDEPVQVDSQQPQQF